MRFLLDESAEYRIAGALASAGHDVTAIAHDYPSALVDHEVLAIAYDEERILITNDRDFGDLVFRDERPHTGVILFRLPAGDTAHKIDLLLDVIESRPDALGEFVVVDRNGIRVRPSGTGSQA